MFSWVRFWPAFGIVWQVVISYADLAGTCTSLFMALDKEIQYCTVILTFLGSIFDIWKFDFFRYASIVIKWQC